MIGSFRRPFTALVFAAIFFRTPAFAAEKADTDPYRALERLHRLGTDKARTDRLAQMAGCYLVIRAAVSADGIPPADQKTFFRTVMNLGAFLGDRMTAGDLPAGTKDRATLFQAVYDYAVFAVLLLDRQIAQNGKAPADVRERDYLDRADLMTLGLSAARQGAALFAPGSHDRRVRLSQHTQTLMTIYWHFPPGMHLPQMHIAASELVALSSREFPHERRKALIVLEQLLKLSTASRPSDGNTRMPQSARNYFKLKGYVTALECAVALSEWGMGIRWYQAMRNDFGGVSPYPALPKNDRIEILDFTVSQADCVKVFLMHYQYCVCLGMAAAEFRQHNFADRAEVYAKESRTLLLDLKKRAEEYVKRCDDRQLAKSVAQNVIAPTWDILGIRRMRGLRPDESDTAPARAKPASGPGKI